MQSAEEVVDFTLRALRHGERLGVPGFKNRLMATLSSHMPRWLGLPLSAKVLRRQFGSTIEDGR
jgi:short-subunit dehydrogenase